MALNKKYISFQPILESVYRRAGYQQIDWAHAVELIGETMRLIGAKLAFKDVITNGVNSAPNPLEVSSFRVAIPSDMVIFEAVRKINLVEESDGEGGTNLKIASFATMYENTDLFYQ